MSKKYHYFVEGECEEKFINLLKQPDIGKLLSGKVEVLNVVNKKISKPSIMQITKGTEIILVYDTDVRNTDTLDFNINMLKKYGLTKIYHIHSVRDFEDEIAYACGLKNVGKFFGANISKNEFKSKFLKDSKNGILNKLKNFDYDNDKMWSRQGSDLYQKYETKTGVKIIKKNK